ncbi:hypothetical protein M1116_00990 [Patescibacteria group bacterium]|nr:hypothetical protein [Patescibacteria group bacterium]
MTNISNEGCPYTGCQNQEDHICWRFRMLEKIKDGQSSGFGPITNFQELDWFGWRLMGHCPHNWERHLELRFILANDLKARDLLTSHE